MSERSCDWTRLESVVFVGQDSILPPIKNRQSANVLRRRPIFNRRQVTNLPYIQLTNEEANSLFLEPWRACDAGAGVDAAAAVEVQKYAARFFDDDLEGRKIPGPSRGFNPDVSLAGGYHHRVRRATQSAHRPELRHPVQQLVFERCGIQLAECVEAQSGFIH